MHSSQFELLRIEKFSVCTFCHSCYSEKTFATKRYSIVIWSLQHQSLNGSQFNWLNPLRHGFAVQNQKDHDHVVLQNPNPSNPRI